MIMITVAFLLGMILCLLFGVPYISFLKKKMIGQYVKDVAPEAHQKKEGTPTTGGVFIIIAAVMASIIALMLAQRFSEEVFIVLITFLFYAFAGFQDDYLKLKGKHNDGLSARGKLLRQIAIALLPTAFVMMTNPDGTYFSIGSLAVDLRWLYPVLSVFVITGASNAYNLTDGLDGLASSTGVFAFIACALILLLNGHPRRRHYCGFCCRRIVRIFEVQQTESRSLYGRYRIACYRRLLGTLAVIGKFEFLLIFIGGIFVIETLSVILQVISFKTTGKRIFKMSPIHHHFELCGWSEKRIVVTFALVSALFNAFALGLFYLTQKGLF